eukprot:4752119-Pyramimonas_sp.AAC.1
MRSTPAAHGQKHLVRMGQGEKDAGVRSMRCRAITKSFHKTQASRVRMYVAKRQHKHPNKNERCLWPCISRGYGHKEPNSIHQRFSGPALKPSQKPDPGVHGILVYK